MTRLSYRRVGVAYPDSAPVLADLELDLTSGEVLLLVGASGSGKSTVLRCANGLVPHSSGGRFTGEVLVGDRSTRDHRPRDLADVVGFVQQDPAAQFVVDHVERDIAFSLENLGTDPTAMRRRVEEALDALGIAHLRDRSPHTLSGGERQRAAIAGAIATGPSVLVLDEPTSELDPQGADDVLAALARLNTDLGTTVLLAEHRLERAAPLADRVALLERDSGPARLSGLGAAADVLPDYAGAATVTHLGRLLDWDPPPLTVRDARRRARERAADLPPLPPPTEAVTTAPGAALLRARDVRVERRQRAVLRDVDVEVREGEVVVVLGRNGAGKSTLLQTLAGLLTPERGDVDRSARVAYVPQDPDALLAQPTVRRELAETLRLLGRADDEAVTSWLHRMELGSLSERHPRSLSGGERQRAAIAAVAVGGAPVLCLDEPTRGIDARSRDLLADVVTAHAGAGGAVVLATHDVELAARVATRAVVLGDGDVVASGAAREVLAGSLFAPQTLRVLPPYLTLDEVRLALGAGVG